MKIVVCTDDPNMQDDIRYEFSGVSLHASARFVRSLTEAYHLTEHHIPKYLFVDAKLARAQEFELLASLASLLDVPTALLQREGGNLPTLDTQQLPQIDVSEMMSLIVNRQPDQFSRQKTPLPAPSPTNENEYYDEQKIILIGASTGGIDALIRVLMHWTKSAPPTLIVQHTGSGHIPSLVRLLGHATPPTVQVAVNGSTLQRGHVYLASGEGKHLGIAGRNNPKIKSIAAPPVSGHIPSVDILFGSGVPFGDRIVAALLTGMGKDGAHELKSLRHAGAHTIGQDKATSVVYGMPGYAMKIGAVCEELPLDSIGPALLAAARSKRQCV